MLLGFLGIIGLSLSTDKNSYAVGDAPIYRVEAAVPGSRIAWTSYKNGQTTGEYQADYGQAVGANGTAELTGGAWADADIGNWTKEAIVIAPDGKISNATISFSVHAKATTPASPTNPAGAGLFDGTVNLPIVGNISKPVAILGAVGLFFFLSKRGR